MSHIPPSSQPSPQKIHARIPKGWAKQGSQIKARSLFTKITEWIQKLGIKLRSLFSRKAHPLTTSKLEASSSPSKITIEKETKMNISFKEGEKIILNLKKNNSTIHLKIKQYKDLCSAENLLQHLNHSTKQALSEAALKLQNNPGEILTIHLNAEEAKKIQNTKDQQPKEIQAMLDSYPHSEE